MPKNSRFTEEQISSAKAYAACTPPDDLDSQIEILVNDLIGHVADKWTMLILEVLIEKGELRFTRLSEFVVGISQKMLTQTLRLMEREGLITRTVHPVVPPKVVYKLTQLGMSLGGAFCGVWVWAAANIKQVEKARLEFDEKSKLGASLELGYFVVGVGNPFSLLFWSRWMPILNELGAIVEVAQEGFHASLQSTFEARMLSTHRNVQEVAYAFTPRSKKEDRAMDSLDRHGFDLSPNGKRLPMRRRSERSFAGALFSLEEL